VGIAVGFTRRRTGMKKPVTGELTTVIIMNIIIFNHTKSGIDSLYLKRKENGVVCYKMKRHIWQR
jgi:hypothetical protein